MNDMNNAHMNQFILVEDTDIDEEQKQEENVSIYRVIGYFGILAIICIMSFLIAKYILRSNIGWEETPIDTSERL